MARPTTHTEPESRTAGTLSQGARGVLGTMIGVAPGVAVILASLPIRGEADLDLATTGGLLAGVGLSLGGMIGFTTSPGSRRRPTTPATQPRPARGIWFWAGTGVSAALQVLVVTRTVLAGRSFADVVTYTLAILQGLVSLILLSQLAYRRRRVTFLVPVASTGLTAILMGAGLLFSQ